MGLHNRLTRDLMVVGESNTEPPWLDRQIG